MIGKYLSDSTLSFAVCNLACNPTEPTGKSIAWMSSMASRRRFQICITSQLNCRILGAVLDGPNPNPFASRTVEIRVALTLHAIKYMIWLQLVAIVLGLFLSAYEPSQKIGFSMALNAVSIGLLYLFSIGLSKEFAWVAVLFVVFCVFNLLSAVVGGISLASILDLADAVLSFVAICGIVIWFREREADPTTKSASD
jgi:uncharacterized membrane protein